MSKNPEDMINVWPNGYWCPTKDAETDASHMSDDFMTVDTQNSDELKKAAECCDLCLEELQEYGYNI